MQWYARRQDIILSPGNSIFNQLWKVLSKAISKYFWLCESLILVKRNSRINVVDSKESNIRFGNVTCRGISLMKKIEGKNKRKDEKVYLKCRVYVEKKTIFFFSIQIVRNFTITVCFNHARVMPDRKWWRMISARNQKHGKIPEISPFLV